MHWFIRQFCFYWAPLLVWMSFVFWWSSQSPDSVGKLDPGVPFAFEIAHFIEFAVLAALSYWAFRASGRLSLPILWGSVAGFTALYAISDEAHQAFTPGRVPSVIDLAVDVAGGVAGLALADLLLRKILPLAISGSQQIRSERTG